MMDNQKFDRWMQQELEQYQFVEIPVLPQMDAVLDKVERLRDGPNWWQKYWKGGMFGGIAIGGLIALSTYNIQSPSKPTAYTPTDTLNLPFVSGPIQVSLLASSLADSMGKKIISSIDEPEQITHDLRALSDYALGERLAPSIILPATVELDIKTIPLRKIKPLTMAPIAFQLNGSAPQYRAKFLLLRKNRSGDKVNSWYDQPTPRHKFPSTNRTVYRPSPRRSIPSRTRGRRVIERAILRMRQGLSFHGG